MFHVESYLALCSCVFSVLVSIVITSLGEERACLCALVHLFVYFATNIFSSSWFQGLAVACDCGAPWTFLLTIFFNQGFSLQTEVINNKVIIIDLLW